jgi:OFA family oxalate/formate antiporter-like MFS transporter
MAQQRADRNRRRAGATMGAFGNAGGRILSGWLGFARPADDARIMVLVSALPCRCSSRSASRSASSTPRHRRLLVLRTQLSVFASTTADFYGTKNLGMNYGALFTAWGAAGVLAPHGPRVRRDEELSYAFYAAAAGARCACGAADRPAHGPATDLP